MSHAMYSRLVTCLLIWCSLFLGGSLSIKTPSNTRLPRSPQMPPTVSARQPPRRISAMDSPTEALQIEQKSPHKHPYLSRYEYNDMESYRKNEKKESQKRSAMPSSPFIASRISVSDSQSKMATEIIPESKSGNHKDIQRRTNSYSSNNDRKNTSPERSIKEYLNIRDKFSYSEQDQYPAGSYEKVLDEMRITDNEARSILKKKGVLFDEFINFIAGGASMEQVKQILYITDMKNMRKLNITDNANISKNKIRYDEDNSQNVIKPPKEKSKYTNSYKSDFQSVVFDANALPSKDSPMISHFRKPQTKPHVSSASILSLSVEETEKLPIKEAVSNEHYNPHKSESSIKINANYQSDQAAPSSPEFRFEDGLRMFLIICGGIGGIILLATVMLVIYNVLTCKESRMAQRNYELSKQIRCAEESMEIC